MGVVAAVVRGLTSRSPAALVAIGIVATLAVALTVVWILWFFGNSVSANAALIAALLALGGVFTTQLVNIGLEAQRARETALQNYLEQVGKLLIEHQEDTKLRAVARAQTLAVLAGLDADRKRILLQFLYESKLINVKKRIVSLLGANLSEAELMGAYLNCADLRGADLRRADLEDADLSYVDLREVAINQEQIEWAKGDETTKLPDHLRRPAHWNKGDEEESDES